MKGDVFFVALTECGVVDIYNDCGPDLKYLLTYLAPVFYDLLCHSCLLKNCINHGSPARTVLQRVVALHDVTAGPDHNEQILIA